MIGIGYKQRTKRLGIPVVGFKDRISPEVEMLKWQMVENLLMANLRGKADCLFEEGEVSFKKRESGLFDAVLAPTGEVYAAKGLVGGAYFEAPTRLLWGDLKVGYRYTLYIGGSVETFSNPFAVEAIASRYEISRNMLLKVAVLDLTGEIPFLDRTPKGRVHLDDVVDHVAKDSNPHGDVLYQDGLVVNRLVLGAEVEVDGMQFGKDKVLQAFSGVSASEVVEFETNGQEGAVLLSSGGVSFVLVSVSGKGKVGDIRVGYFGQDEKIEKKTEFVVYNTGDAGILCRALVVSVGSK